MFELFAVTLPTLGLTYVTATPHARRARHREIIVTGMVLCWDATRRAWYWCRWQAAVLPGVMRKEVSHDDE